MTGDESDLMVTYVIKILMGQYLMVGVGGGVVSYTAISKEKLVANTQIPCRKLIKYQHHLIYDWLCLLKVTSFVHVSGAPNENIVQNRLNIALLNVF